MEQSPNASPTRLVDAFWLDWSDDGTVVNALEIVIISDT